jgi:hypothetical protein
MPRTLLILTACLSLGTCAVAVGGEPPRNDARARKIVLIAGPLDQSHPPGTHEYEKSVRLLKHCLDASPDLKGVRTEAHRNGWPDDPKTLDAADTVVLVASGSDRREQDHPLLVGDRLAVLDKQMKRGCGLVLIHWATFVPKDKAGDRVLEWVGGYFDYESGPPPRGWYSKIQTATTKARPATPAHAVCNGLGPFELREEYYYHIRFRERDPRLTPVLATPIPGEKEDQVVAWAVQRKDGGRGFGFTGGHFFDNWQVENFRKMVLNAVAWTAGAEVPEGGVRSKMPTAEEIARVPLAGKPPPAPPSRPEPTAEGKFGAALDARAGLARAEEREAYRKLPLTVECWAQVFSKGRFNVLVAHAPKTSATHWEIYTYAGSGAFSAYLPGYRPDEIKSDTDVTDGKWHHVAMTCDGKRVRLFVDGKQVKDQAVERVEEEEGGGPLWFGAYPPQGIGCDGKVDEVRISDVVRKMDALPASAPAADENTVGLWHFDRQEKGQFADASRLKNPAVVAAPAGPAPAPAPARPGDGAELDYRPADPRLRAILIDRSESESYVAVKADTTGRLFVGGREALFVFEPDDRGGYRPKRELFRFPPDSWIAGIEVRGNDLYVLTAAALYLLPEARVKREGLTVKRLLWGLPLDLHVSYHSLAWGPEGDLYLNHGDPLLGYGDFGRPDHWGHWTLFTGSGGTNVPYTGQGAVERLRPDGGGLRVVAGGLRGCFGLTFDRHWNLFTNDNDHESIPDRYTPARLLFVSPHADFAWPRGWIASQSPDRADLLEPLHNTPGRGVPVGLTYYDETFLPAEYRHSLLEDRWEALAVWRYPLTSRGAGFAATARPFLQGRQHARPVGVAVGRGGRVFVTVSYMAGNEASPHYVSDLVMVTRADDEPTHPFDAYDAPAAPAENLWAELSDPSLRRRLEAHTEILRRGGDGLVEAARRLAAVREDDPARFHLPWLAGAAGTAEGARTLLTLAGDGRADLRLQAVRVLAEFGRLQAPREVFAKALADPEPAVRLAGLGAFFDLPGELPLPAVVKLASSEDTYLRQTAATLLARKATLADLEGLAKAPQPRVRLAGVLAAGFRLTVPPPDAEPPAGLRLVLPADNAFFKGKSRYADGETDLRAAGRVGSYTAAEWWRAIKPNAEQQALFDLLRRALNDAADPVRLQAAYFLSLLRDAKSEPEVAAVFNAVQENRLAAAPLRTVDRVWMAGPFDDGGQGFKQAHAPEQGAIDLSADYPTKAGKVAWQELAGKDGVLDPPPPVAARGRGSVYFFFRLQSAVRQPALLVAETAAGLKVWHNGRDVWEREAGAARRAAGQQRPADPPPARRDRQGAAAALPGAGRDGGRVAREAELRDPVAAPARGRRGQQDGDRRPGIPRGGLAAGGAAGRRAGGPQAVRRAGLCEMPRRHGGPEGRRRAQPGGRRPPVHGPVPGGVDPAAEQAGRGAVPGRRHSHRQGASAVRAGRQRNGRRRGAAAAGRDPQGGGEERDRGADGEQPVADAGGAAEEPAGVARPAGVPAQRQPAAPVNRGARPSHGLGAGMPRQIEWEGLLFSGHLPGHLCFSPRSRNACRTSPLAKFRRRLFAPCWSPGPKGRRESERRKPHPHRRHQ